MDSVQPGVSFIKMNAEEGERKSAHMHIGMSIYTELKGVVFYQLPLFPQVMINAHWPPLYVT